MTDEFDRSGILSVDEKSKDSTIVFGFWMYLMTDLVLFASLFVVFVVLRGPEYGGASIKNTFDLQYVFIETIALLVSSFTCGLALLFAREGNVRGTVSWLLATFVLGAAFVAMEVSEFSRLLAQGLAPARDGFLSGYFTLVGTHGAHVTVGLLWLLAMVVAIAGRGLSRGNMRKLALFAMFWHFLDVIWIFIFTIVYLMGVL
ncbi:MAG: cytochrome o ubiquinol oxidase subunit III [Candidatus Pacebacteria bacterium]|nr:cytochrome o ubiquinol oxidase subunit III [Candidatus Paceibacterota bacterium]